MTRLIWGSCLLACLAAGCASPNAAAPESAPVSQARANYDAAFRAATETLAAYRFRIDRVDRRAGVIETFPMTGKSWLEPWRSDGATMWDTWESTLQTIYRTATVRFVPSGPDTYQVRVRIAVSRADRRTLQITNTSQAYALFQMQRGRRRARRLMEAERHRRPPVALDDDLVLAMFIRRDIEKRMREQ